MLDAQIKGGKGEETRTIEKGEENEKRGADHIRNG
jgi:hypothetical protein